MFLVNSQVRGLVFLQGRPGWSGHVQAAHGNGSVTDGSAAASTTACPRGGQATAAPSQEAPWPTRSSGPTPAGTPTPGSTSTPTPRSAPPAPSPPDARPSAPPTG